MSGGKSKQTQTQTFTDNRVVTGEGGITATGGSAVSNFTSTTNMALDNGAINRAFDFATDASVAGSRTASDAIRQALDFAGDTQGGLLSAVSGALGFGRSSLDFASDAQAGLVSSVANALGFGRSSLDFASDTQAGAFGTVADALRQVLNFAGDTQGDVRAGLTDALGFGRSAFDFASDANAGALATVNANVGSTLRSALDYASDTNAGALSGVLDTVRQAFNFGGDAMAGNASLLDRVLTFSANNTNRALDNLQYTQQLTADAYADAKGRGALTDKIIIGAIAAMAVVAFMAVRKG